MNFTTQIPLSKSPNPIDYHSKIITMGSCFAANMGAKFDYFKFQHTTNPFGIIFNPVSIAKLVSRVVNQHLFTEKNIFFYHENWHCYEVHSELSNPNKKLCLAGLNELVLLTHKQIQEATHFIITLGTSWVYRHIETSEIVSNCHKVPQKKFTKELLSIAEIEKSLEQITTEIQTLNPNCHFIFTISPVRHIKDGFVENQQSKAHLISAIHSSIFRLPTSSYFPSYEIMMDELRDYRFYAEDMLHPSQVAVNYIWERFSETIISGESHSIMQEVETIQKGLAHRPFNPNSQSHQDFLLQLNQKISQFEEKYYPIQFC
jgi:GSCFA family